MKKPIISVLSALTGAAIGAGALGKVLVGERDKVQSLSDKHLSLFLMMNQWVRVKQEGRSLAACLEKNGYKKIAVYGMSYAGETLLEELKGTGIEVAYGIDKKANGTYLEVDVFSPEDELPKVDAVVVTAITYFEELKEMLSARIDCPILSLEDILYDEV